MRGENRILLLLRFYFFYSYFVDIVLRCVQCIFIQNRVGMLAQEMQRKYIEHEI